MQRFVLLALCIAVLGVTPAPTPSPPPQIYHIVTTLLCTRMHDIVRPAVAMMLENDQRLAKGKPLFEKYRQGMLEAGEDKLSGTSPQTDMTMQQMSYLVLPTAKNLIAAQTLLDQPQLVAPTGSSTDDATLALIRNKLLQTLAFQSATLDLINGFVQTQQMGELQHVGEEYLGSIEGSETTAKITQATPNPWQDPDQAGLTPNPYAFDVAQIPGLAIGYNPLSRVIDGMTWLQEEKAKHEDDAGKAISAALGQCPK